MPTQLEVDLTEAAANMEHATLRLLREAEWPAKRIEQIMSAWDSGHNCDTVHFETDHGKPLTAFLHREDDPEKAVVEEVKPGWL